MLYIIFVHKKGSDEAKQELMLLFVTNNDY